MINNPIQSIQTIQDTLHQFSSVSYYKLNTTKSIVLPIHLPPQMTARLKSTLPYMWASTSIPYLGIQIAPNPKQLTELNYLTFSRNLPTLLNSLCSTGLSTLGRIASFKMIILPKLLYLFWTLILSLPRSLLTSIQSQLTKYIWNSKPPRCAGYILTRHQSKGGVSLPHIDNYYYYASILDQIYHWWHPAPEKIWSTIEAFYP